MRDAEVELPLTAGARVRIVIEATVESLDSGLTLTDGIRIECGDLGKLGITVLEAGWQPGDIAADGSGPLARLRRPGRFGPVDHWVRVNNGRVVYDDETSLASLTAVSRANGEAS